MLNTCLLYVVVEIRQLVNEISSFPEVFYKRGDLKNFSKFTDKQKKQSTRGVLTKDVLKNFAKFLDKHLCPSLFFNKVAGWKPETVRSSNWRCSVKKVFLRRRTGASEPAFHRSFTKCSSWINHKIRNKKSVLQSRFNNVAVLRTCNFIKEDSYTGAFL